eukprot:359887_1
MITNVIISLLFTCIEIKCISANSVYITPTYIPLNINITTDDDVTADNSKWNLLAPSSSTDTKWCFELAIYDKSLQFQKSTTSILTIILDGAAVTSDMDLFLSIGTQNKYFVFAMGLDTTFRINGLDGTHIYPSCDTNLVDGDVRLVMNESAQLNSLAGGTESNWYRLTSVNNVNNWPLIFEVTNNILKNESVFTFYSPRNAFDNGISCTFGDLFEQEEPVYFMMNPEANDEAIDIYGITISLYSEEEKPRFMSNTKSLSWNNAESYCLFHYDQHLASIHSIDENSEAKKLSLDVSNWIGLNDIQIENEWQWSDGTDLDYYFWANGQPSNSPSEDCVEINVNGYMNENACTVTKQSLCNYPSKTYIFNNQNFIHRPTNQMVGIVDVLDDISINFNFKILSWTTNQELTTLLQIGNTQTDKYTKITINSTNKNVMIELLFINNVINKYYSDNNSIELGKLHSFSMLQTQNSLLIQLDNITLYDITTSSHPVVFSQNIYLGSNELTESSTNSTFSNVQLTSNNAFKPDSFNYLCDSDRFSIITGSWSFNKVLCTVRQTIDTQSDAKIWIGDNDPTSMLWKNYKIEAQFTIHSSGNTGGYSGITFRVTGTDYYYNIALDINNGIRLSRRSGLPTSLHQVATTFNHGQLYTLRIEVMENNFDIYINDIYQFSDSDNSYSFGSVGLKTNQAEVTFSSLRIMFPTDNCLHVTNEECVENPICFYSRNATQWTGENGIEIQSLTNSTVVIHSGAPQTITKVMLNECFSGNMLDIYSIHFDYQYFYGDINSNNFPSFKLALQPTSECYNDIVLYESGDLSQQPPNGKMFTDLINTQIIIDGNINIDNREYKLYLQFTNNDNYVVINLETLNIYIDYKSDNVSDIGLTFDIVNANEYINTSSSYIHHHA